MSIDAELLKDFQSESKNLIAYMMEILETCESNFAQVKRLEDYGQNVDRIMGGAKSLATMELDKSHLIHKIGDYAAICKAVGYKASQIRDNQNFYDICVALLLDATESLSLMVDSVAEGKNPKLREMISQTIIDRVRWVSAQFSAEYRSSVSIPKGEAPKMDQNQIDDLLKKLGLGDDD